MQRLAANNENASPARLHSSSRSAGLEGGALGGGAVTVRIVVAIVSVEVAEPFAGGVTELGEKEHEELAGLPEQLNDTAELKPFTEVTVTVNVVEEPAVTVAEVGLAEIVKSGTAKSFATNAFEVPFSDVWNTPEVVGKSLELVLPVT